MRFFFFTLSPSVLEACVYFQISAVYEVRQHFKTVHKQKPQSLILVSGSCVLHNCASRHGVCVCYSMLRSLLNSFGFNNAKIYFIHCGFELFLYNMFVFFFQFCIFFYSYAFIFLQNSASYWENGVL